MNKIILPTIIIYYKARNQLKISWVDLTFNQKIWIYFDLFTIQPAANFTKLDFWREKFLFKSSKLKSKDLNQTLT